MKLSNRDHALLLAIVVVLILNQLHSRLGHVSQNAGAHAQGRIHASANLLAIHVAYANLLAMLVPLARS